MLRRTTGGTPQGGVISPLLSNIYLHYVLDEWFETVVRPRLKGRCQLVRHADDAVVAFEDHLSGKRLLAVLGKRLERFGLTLHPTKTRFVDFWFNRPQGRRGLGARFRSASSARRRSRHRSAGARRREFPLHERSALRDASRS